MKKAIVLMMPCLLIVFALTAFSSTDCETNVNRDCLLRVVAEVTKNGDSYDCSAQYTEGCSSVVSWSVNVNLYFKSGPSASLHLDSNNPSTYTYVDRNHTLRKITINAHARDENGHIAFDSDSVTSSG